MCIAGASYGAYSAMMGLVREPSLDLCGIGYAGLYDRELWKPGQRGSLDVGRSRLSACGRRQGFRPAAHEGPELKQGASPTLPLVMENEPRRRAAGA